MNQLVLFVPVFTIVSVQASPLAGDSIAKYARDIENATAAVGGTLVLHASTESTAAKASTVSEELNNHLARDYLIAFASLAFVFILYRLVLQVIHYHRTLACLSNCTQRYFATPNNDWNNLKTNLLHAPLWKTRHNRELHLSSALNIGTLPTRFQSLLLACIVVANITLCVYGIPWQESETQVLPVLRNRTGSIAVANLVPVMVLSSPKNPFIKLLNIPFDSMHVIHRNLARLAVCEAIVHVLCWMIGNVKTSGWAATGESFIHSNLVMTGTVATLALLLVLVQSSSAIRHAFYEVFLHLHVALIILTLVFLWFHLTGLPQRNYLVAAIMVWIVMRLLRLLTFIKYNLGREGTKASIEILPGDALRLCISTARNVEAQPGSYFYLYIPSVGLWTAHPFSVAWSDNELPLSVTSSESMYEEKPAMKHNEVDPKSKQIMSAVLRRRTGFTDSLYRKADEAGARNGVKLTLNAYVEAGYGIHHSVLSSCGTVLLFAAGVGITHHVPYIRHLVQGYAAGTVATRKVVLYWVMQSPEHLEWIRPWIIQILAMERRREVLMIKLFITRPKQGREVTSPSATVQMFPGRPVISDLLRKECAAQIGCMGVSACGPGGFSDDVRAAVRQQTTRNIEFVEEAFTW